MVRIEVSEVIDRPASDVFRFFAIDHVRNHPRWDPYIELEPTSDEPIGVGTVIRRRNSRSGTPVEGTMKVVEFEPDKTFAMVIHDGPMEIHSRALLKEASPGRTTFTGQIEIPGMDESMDTQPMKTAIEQSFRKMKELIEADA